MFKNIIKTFDTPDLDLFATRINKKLLKFAFRIRAKCHRCLFSGMEADMLLHFPHFSLVAKVLPKACKEKTIAITIIPN